MTKFKKIIPALCMLLISAVLMGTSTYAWFSMNTTVSATGMQVQAKSDAKFLQIKTSGAEWNDTDSFVSATVETAKKEIYPTQAVKSVGTDKKSVAAFDGTSLVWVSTYSTDPADANAGVGTKNEYTTIEDVTTNHALKESFTVRLKPNSGVTTAGSLTVNGVTFAAAEGAPTDSLINSLRVLFVCGENKFIWKNGAFVGGKTGSLLSDSVTTADLTVEAYVYFDGSDEACTTNNALTPDSYTLTFTLLVG